MELVDERPENLAQHDHSFDIATSVTPILSCVASTASARSFIPVFLENPQEPLEKL